MRTAIIFVASLALAGCDIVENDAQRGYGRNLSWSTPTTYTTGSVRIITQRTHPVLHNEVVCTEPPPDVAQAVATALSGSGNSGNVGGSLSGASAEAIAELAGRSTALLGLRDGLFRACEAYANGAIGQDAYALVISRYGHLMTTLFLGQDITGAAGTAAKAADVSATTDSNKATPAPTPTPSPPAPAKPAAAGSTDAAPLPPAASAAQMLASASGVNLPPQVWLTVDKEVQAQSVAASAVIPAAAAAGTPGAAQTPAVGAPATNTSSTSTPPASTDTSSVAKTATPQTSLVAASSLTLGRMNEDYFNLDNYPLHLLIVACINNGDQTRMRSPIYASTPAPGVPLEAPPPLKNTYLDALCANLADPKTIAALQDSELKQAASIKPINPEAAAAQSASSNAGNSQPTKNMTPNKTVLAVQDALLGLLSQTKCDPGTNDGIDGPKTQAAVLCYQKYINSKGLGPLQENGKTEDPDTLKSLKVAIQSPQPPGAPAKPERSA